MEKSQFISMGVNELLYELLTNENVQFGEIDNYNHIKKNTNNFEPNSIVLMFRDIKDFLEGKVHMKFEGELYPLHLLSDIKLQHPNDLRKFGIKNGVKLQNTIEYGDWENNDTNENELDKFLNLASTLNWNNEDLELEYNLYEVNKYVNMFNFQLETRKIDIKKLLESKEPILIDTNKNNRFEPKQPLTFPELFKPAYSKNLNVLFERLMLNGFVDSDKNWIIKNSISEPAKLYYYLKEKQVLNVVKFTPSIKCFYKEFGCEVVEKDNGNPRATTRKNAVDAEFSNEINFDSFLSTWIENK